jgi:hypothetical protein
LPGDVIPGSERIEASSVPEGHYYITGNSSNALDSRVLGAMKYGQVQGRVVWTFKN